MAYWEEDYICKGLIGFTSALSYDTVYLRALKSWRDNQPNLAHGSEMKKKTRKKLKTKTE